MARQSATAQKQTEADPQSVIDRVQDLVSLATNNDNPNEAASSALKAVQLMKDHELTVLPRRDLEAAQQVINGAKELVAKAEQKANGRLVTGIALGLLAGRAKLF